jgi:hypothetical protein
VPFSLPNLSEQATSSHPLPRLNTWPPAVLLQGVVLRELSSDPKLVNLHSEIEAALAKNDYRNSGLLLF